MHSLRLQFAVLLALAAFPAYAQTVFGTIFGTVTDPAAGKVPNARVTITEVDKNVILDTTTNASGNYSRGQLIPGNYRVEVEAAGFRKAIIEPVIVRVDQTARVDVQLSVGGVSETVEVTSGPALLETTKTEVATTFTSQQIVGLPNLSRNLVSMMFLVPGVQSIGGATPVSENPQGGFRVMVNGQNFGNTGYQLDGTDNQDPILGNIVINPNLDSLAEAKFATQDFDAEFGYVGAGMFVISTKSGSNQFHGSAFNYLSNNSPNFKTAGRNPFTEPNGAPTAKSNQFGGSLGGRILKDRLFFFGDAQLTRRRQDANVLTTVPTLAARGGDLGGYLNQNGAVINNVVYDPASGVAATGQNRLPFANNVIPGSRLSAQAQALLKFFPAPNTQVGGIPYRNNYIASGTTRYNAEQWGGRVDYYRGRDTFFGRFTQAAFDLNVPGAFGSLAGGPGLDASGFSGASNVLNHSIAAGFTRSVSARSVNEFRFGFFRYRVDVQPGGFGTQPALEAGIPGLNLDKTFTSGLPFFNITGDGGSGLGYSLTLNRCNCPLAQRERQFQFVDNFSHTRGNHALKFGADVRYALNLRVPSDLHRSGELVSAPGFTGRVDANGATTQGLGLGTFLLGQVTSFQRYVSPNTEAAERQKRMYFYGQDNWRISSKLSVNFGMRWELIFPETVNAPGNGGALDLSTGRIAVYGAGKVPLNGIQEMTWTNIAPRVGLAYQLNSKTVVRAGYGWSYGLGVFGSVFGHVTTQNLPVLASQALNPANSFSGVFTLAQGPSAPVFPQADADGFIRLPNGVTPRVRPRQITLPLVMAHNLSVQRQFTNHMTATVSYVGNQGRHVLNGNGNVLDLNQPAFIPGVPNQNQRRPYFARYGWTQGVTYYCNCANSSYDSLQAKMEMRNWHGYTVSGSYIYQYARGDSANSYTFLYNRPLGYGNQPTISTQQILVNQVADLPFGKGRKFGTNLPKTLDLFLGGWNASGTTTFYTGLPFTATIGNFPAQVNGVPYTRPDVGPAYPDRGTVSPFEEARRDRTQWFRGGLGTAFLLPSANTYGNNGFNNLYGPKFIQQDVALAKAFRVRESIRLQLRAEALNVFNHTNLGLPNGNVTDNAAGQITSIPFGTSMRRLQFALRAEF
jgi:hypothetical protein